MFSILYECLYKQIINLCCSYMYFLYYILKKPWTVLLYKPLTVFLYKSWINSEYSLLIFVFLSVSVFILFLFSTLFSYCLNMNIDILNKSSALFYIISWFSILLLCLCSCFVLLYPSWKWILFWLAMYSLKSLIFCLLLFVFTPYTKVSC